MFWQHSAKQTSVVDVTVEMSLHCPHQDTWPRNIRVMLVELGRLSYVLLFVVPGSLEAVLVLPVQFQRSLSPNVDYFSSGDGSTQHMRNCGRQPRDVDPSARVHLDVPAIETLS